MNLEEEGLKRSVWRLGRDFRIWEVFLKGCGWKFYFYNFVKIEDSLGS